MEMIQIIRNALSGFDIINESSLPTGLGTQIRLNNGAMLDVYDRGSVVVSGQNADQVIALLAQRFRQRNSRTFVLNAPSEQRLFPGFAGGGSYD